MNTEPEIEQIRQAVGCPLLLEKHGFKLDVRESSRANPKYRRGAGEIIIVNHDGNGWWDPNSTAKGDVFSLAQHLDPSLNFGQVKRELRELIGLTPSMSPAAPRTRGWDEPVAHPTLRWSSRPKLREGSESWRYLVLTRGLPAAIVANTGRADNVREGPYGSAWFAHRDGAGGLTGIEMRGANYRGFSAGGEKTLFRLQLGTQLPTRLAVLEAPIKAMAFAAIEGNRTDTLYVGTAGGMGPATLHCLQQEMTALATRPGGRVIAASDADAAGERYAVRIGELASEAGVPSERAAPVGCKDWDDALKAQAGAIPPPKSLISKDPASWRSRAVAMARRMETIEQPSARTAADRLARRNAGAKPRVERRGGPDMGSSS